MTESLQREKVIKARDIAGQTTGHFTGKVAGGKPPYFNVQFDLSHYEEKEIPAFSKPISLGSSDKKKLEMEMEIMEEIVEKHYYSIITQVNEVLERVKAKV